MKEQKCIHCNFMDGYYDNYELSDNLLNIIFICNNCSKATNFVFKVEFLESNSAE